MFWVLWEIFIPRTTRYDDCWLAGKTRGRNERYNGDLRPLINDALARAAGTPPHQARTKCIISSLPEVAGHAGLKIGGN